MSNERQVSKTKQEEKVSALKGVTCTNAGNPISPVYKRVYNDELEINVVQKVDETNLYEFIQASRNQTDLATLQKRFIELGEIPNVNPNLVGEVDTTLMPTDIHSLYNMVNDVNGSFFKLPKSAQDIFGNSQAYLAAILDGTYFQKLAAGYTPKEENKEEKKEGNE